CFKFLKILFSVKIQDAMFGLELLLEKPMEVILPTPPPKFYCELCRLGRADLFWVTVAQPLLPVKLVIANVPTDGTNPMQSVEKTFQLTRAYRELLVKPEYDVQSKRINYLE
ncbi:hypothetical protein M8C21_021375, partial [Ambrosia artemisiifolia]